MAKITTITATNGETYDIGAKYDVSGNEITTTYINENEKGATSGVAPLNSNGEIDEGYLPLSIFNYVSEEGSLVSFKYSKSGTPVTSLKVKINPVQSGSGNPSPTNIRPITGWTEIAVNVTANNLFNKNRATDNKYLKNDGSIGTSNTFCYSDYIGVEESTTLKYFGCANQFGSSPCTCFYDINKGFVGYVRLTSVQGTISIPSGAFYMRMSVAVADKSTCCVSTTSLNAYENFGTTYTISFGSAGTVYGGTLDVTTGVLTVTHKSATVSSLSWSYNSQYTRCFAELAGMVTGKYSNRKQPFMASCFVPISDGRALADIPNNAIYGSGTNSVCYVKTTYTSADAFEEAFGSQTIVYELATPETYVLTAEQVTTLLGQNNICSDAGDVEIAILPEEISNYINGLITSNALVVSQDSTTGELTLQ